MLNGEVIGNGASGTKNHNYAISVAFPVAVALGITQIFGAVFGRLLLEPEIQYKAGSLFQQLLSWDGKWYYNIGEFGYFWNPAIVKTYYQDVAFFPLQGILDFFCILIAGPNAVPLVLLLSWGGGIFSIFRFERLARDTIDEGVPIATILYAFWPASAFYLMGYPTGVLSLCIIEALHQHIKGHKWVSALWLGVGSAAAPTLVFVVFALGAHHFVDWFRQSKTLRDFLALIGWGLLSVSGLETFMLYQALALHDAMAFIKAQDTWGGTVGTVTKILRLMNPTWDLYRPYLAITRISNGYHYVVAGQLQAAAMEFQAGIQMLVNFGAFLLTIIGLVGATRGLKGRGEAIAWAGWLVFIGYLWFIMAGDQNMLATPRLLFPAIGMFLGLGIYIRRSYIMIQTTLCIILICVSFMEMAFVAAGGWAI
jgi:hypothetical protein